MIAQARHHAESGNYYFATTWLERLMKHYPHSTYRKEALMLMAKSYAASDRDERAVVALRTLLKEYPATAQSVDPKLLKLAEEPPPATPAAASAYPAVQIPAQKSAALPQPTPPPSAQPTAARLLPASAVTVAPTKPAAPVIVTTPQPVAVVAVAVAKPVASAPVVPSQPAETTLTEKAQPAATVVVAQKEPATPPRPQVIVPTVEPPKPVATPSRMETAPPPATNVVQSALPAPQPEVNKLEASAPPKPAPEGTTAQAQAPVTQAPVVEAEEPLPSKAAVESADLDRVRTVARDEQLTATHGYTLKIGEYLVKGAMANARKKLLQAGLSPVVTQGPKKKTAMTRLQVEATTDHASARKELDRLHKAKGVGMILKNGEGEYRVYAGSYYDVRKAEIEQERLASFGIKTTLQKVTVPVPTYVLTGGKFPTREAALQEETRLEKQGMRPVVLELQ